MPEHDLTVDEFVDAQVAPELRPVVAALRRFMHDHAAQAREVMSYGIPAYRVRRTIAMINPTRQAITFAFTRGAEFEDGYGLLSGVGTRSKHVKLKKVADVSHPALRDYLEQALKLDELETP